MSATCHDPAMPARVRLDQLLVERGITPTRSRAQALLLGGRVRVGTGDGARRDRKPGDLVDAVGRAIKSVTGIDTKLSTGGGTSDGRFIADICPQVIEFGPTNATIHKVNECIAVADIEPLRKIYQQILVNLLVK